MSIQSVYIIKIPSRMEELKNLDLSRLADMLSVQTDSYLEMLRNGTTESTFNECKSKIKFLIAEIESRSGKNTDNTKEMFARPKRQ